VVKGYVVTDGNETLSIVTTSRAKASGAFIARFAGRIDWNALRTRREPEWDGEEAWECWSDEYDMVSYWGAPVRMA
jgi:hypothetical protein